ncbi:hypothetical protein [Desulfosarcina ovata]|nr:hypothetical protein [Desulfosarcina ovata]
MQRRSRRPFKTTSPILNEKEFVSIVGRKDDMIISGGENVQPAQVEEILNENPMVTDYKVTKEKKHD